ncbi:MAG: hypothetical protein KDL87_20185, partial [Verrucomicrobiae bacterium]|nr:hypothetical protein [Verrucomicrobiae bacterium]
EFLPSDVKELAALRPRLRADQSPDVPDPIGQDQEFFDQIGSQIAALVRPIIKFCRDVSSP